MPESANAMSPADRSAMSFTSAPTAGGQLREAAAALADAAIVCGFGSRPAQKARHGETGRARSHQQAGELVAQLADAVDADSQALFDDYIGWFKVLLHQRGMHDVDLVHHLGCMAEAVRQRMPPSAAAPAVAMIERARAALPAMPGTAASFLDPGEPLSQLAHGYMHALLGGYRQAAGRLVFDAAERGEPVHRLYLQVFQPALREIGLLWQANRISVAQEHFCSAATQVVMSQLLPRAFDAQRNGCVAVVACVAGDQHEVGARMVGDFFEMAGWDNFFCGANTPHAAVVQSVVDRGADVLAVSATMGNHPHAVAELIRTVRADPHCSGLRIMVGGHPFTIEPRLWRAVGADGCAPDADAALALAGQWQAGFAATS